MFLTFEGGEGAGKSTQIKRLSAYLRQKGYGVVILREPGGTRVSEAIREILLNADYKEMVPETELLLYLAARAQIVREKILPALEQGKAVICDRYEDSTRAYQAYGRGLSGAGIESVSRLFVRGRLRPDLTLVLDLPPSRGLARKGGRDRLESESLSFHQRVRKGYLSLARKEPGRFAVIRADQSRAEVFEQIRRALKRVRGGI